MLAIRCGEVGCAEWSSVRSFKHFLWPLDVVNDAVNIHARNQYSGGTFRRIALIHPHRFGTERQLWSYSGLAIETHDSAQYRYVAGQLQRSKKRQLRGLNENHNHDLQNIFKSAATNASGGSGPFHDFYQSLLNELHGFA